MSLASHPIGRRLFHNTPRNTETNEQKIQQEGSIPVESLEESKAN